MRKRRKRRTVKFVRNIYCAKYEICLSMAAHANTFFDCKGCKDFQAGETTILEKKDIQNYYILLEAIFKNRYKHSYGLSERLV
ncbi:MAG: hypothetical protein GY795_13985 [Desulfobacterales bacterium]|nr:hypothetical protein [Desulfobacterales bacterium]